MPVSGYSTPQRTQPGGHYGGYPSGWGRPHPIYGYPTASLPKRSGGGVVATAIAAVFVLVVGGIAVAAGLNSASRTSDTSYSSGTEPTYEPTYTTPNTTEPAPTTEDTPTTTTEAAPTTTEAAPTTEEPTETTEQGPTQVFETADNPLVLSQLGLEGYACELPRFATDAASQDAFYRAMLPCLNEIWAPVLRQANLPFESPNLVTITNDTESKCGTIPGNDVARYCGDDLTIYMTANYYSQVEQIGPYPGRYVSTFVHEYGHHVQWLAGILPQMHQERYDVGDSSAQGLELSRRAELQASCFGGMAMGALTGQGSVDTNMARESLEDAAQRGDYPETGRPRDHGTPQNNGAWMNHGYERNATGDCNTFAADPDTVA
ncbi:hypothetical protein EV191_10124 [Tamaricihabitans halophyticus]|uniref:Metalloprotease n=1 Tax=Tamaricihabitans halophyticus TaxID=1262583 RepID=A0A4R2R2Q6_9PSEU|nr:neutral zinc metallopeptidase [Tamaricihabitans halophyticus]TCP56084.1 hypothetical protein EV191_10124 [Tamaricihabitans halophyticus]